MAIEKIKLHAHPVIYKQEKKRMGPRSKVHFVETNLTRT